MKIYKMYGDKVIDSLVELLKIVSNDIISEVADFDNIPGHEHKNNLLGWKSSMDSVRRALSEGKLVITGLGKDRLYLTTMGVICYDANSERSERAPTEEDQMIYKIGLEEIKSLEPGKRLVKETLVVHLAYGQVILSVDDINGNKVTKQSERMVM